MPIPLAYDDTGGSGPLVVLLPGAGDLRSEHRFLAPLLAERGHRVVTVDLPGHGESPTADRYGVEPTATAIIDLLDQLDAGPAVLVGCSFSPAAAVWAAAERPDLVRGVVAISPHLHADPSLKGKALRWVLSAMMAGPWAGAAWAKAYASWYPSNQPTDLDVELARLRAMLADPGRRRAVRQTLTASREGVSERIARMEVPALVIFGSADSHFPDPATEGRRVASELGAELVLVDGAGHYPHTEHPERVAEAIAGLLTGLR